MVTDLTVTSFHIAGYIDIGGSSNRISVLYNSSGGYIYSLEVLNYDYHYADDVKMKITVTDSNGLECNFEIHDINVWT